MWHNNKLSSTWYRQVVTFHSLAILITYKRTVVSDGFIHWIFRYAAHGRMFMAWHVFPYLKLISIPLIFMNFWLLKLAKSIRCKTRILRNMWIRRRNLNTWYKSNTGQGGILDNYHGALWHLDSPYVVVFTLRKFNTALLKNLWKAVLYTKSLCVVLCRSN